MIHPEVSAYARAVIVREPVKPILVISGPPGTGKTKHLRVIARWWAWRMSYRFTLAQGQIVFQDTVHAMSMVKPNKSLATLFVAGASFTEAAAASEKIQSMIRPELLMIDDLGREPKWCPPDTMASGLCDLLDERVDRRRATIITTNLSGKELGQRYGARLRSRLAGFAQEPVVLAGRDFRIKA